MKKFFELALEAATWTILWGVLLAFFYFLLDFDLLIGGS